MPARKKITRYKDLVEDADGALRALSRRFPEALPAIMLRPGEEIASAGWRESQVAVPQVRMDRVLEVELIGGSSRLLHAEWTDRFTTDVHLRMGRYQLSVALAEQVDMDAAEKCWQGGEEYQRVESMVVVLRGRKKPWPQEGDLRTTPDDAKFGGAWYRIDAVYQRTVAELEARGSPFWLAFVPLAIDVNEEKLRRIIKGLRNKVREEDFDELVATMLSMAKLKKDWQALMAVIRSAAAKEKPMHPFLRDGIEQGMEKGLRKGRTEGLQEGLQKGLQKGLAALVRIFELRLGRSLTERERQQLAKRMNEDESASLGDVVINLSPEQLAAWLATPRASGRTR